MKDKYDVIIIGAGIGGLVCGCYLAKAGMKILIVEQNAQVGGYCTSFSRKGFIFDAAVHSLRGINAKNQLGIIFKDLDLGQTVALTRIDPSDIIIYGKKKLYIYNKITNTIESLKEFFPNQRQEIERFFSFLLTTDFFELYKLTHRKTLSEVLDNFFDRKEIKTCLNILLGNLGLDHKHVSAISALVFYKELFTDGGYYPKNGLQFFSNALAKKIRQFGGDVFLLKKVDKIVVRNNTVKGIVIQGNTFIEGKIVVSNSDARNTYFNLIGNNNLNKDFITHLSSLTCSPSAFIVYLGILGNLKNQDKCCTLWYFPSQDSTNCYKEVFSNKMHLFGEYVVCGLSSSSSKYNLTPGKTSISLTSVVPWKSKDYWLKQREKISKKIIGRASEILDICRNKVEIKEIATPLTLNKYTSNHNGAAYGWACLPEQINKWILPQKGKIKGLYLCGHWATRGWGQGGISMTANSGRTTANMIIKSCVR